MARYAFVAVALCAVSAVMAATHNPGDACTGAVAYCLDVASPIILRCEGTLSPGNCDDNLDEPPQGALCVQSSPTAGDAQCRANPPFSSAPAVSSTTITTTISSYAASFSSRFANSTTTTTVSCHTSTTGLAVLPSTTLPSGSSTTLLSGSSTTTTSSLTSTQVSVVPTALAPAFHVPAVAAGLVAGVLGLAAAVL